MTSKRMSDRRASVDAVRGHMLLQLLRRFSTGGLSTPQAGRVFHPTRPAPPLDLHAGGPSVMRQPQREEDSTMATNPSTESLVDTVDAGQVTVVTINARTLTDTQFIAAVVNEVRTISWQIQSPNILLDFHRVEHLSVEFVTEIKKATDDIEARGGTIRCCSLRREPRALLRTLGLDDHYVGNTVGHAVMRYTAYLQKQGNGTMSTISPRRYSAW